MRSNEPERLRRMYELRFGPNADDRQRVWRVLCRRFFQRHVPPDASVLDLGCGRGEFINNIEAGKKLALDLNPGTAIHLAPDVEFIGQDSATPWRLPDEALDVVFTSNFLEHMPDRAAVDATMAQVVRCLRPGGSLVAMGPNIRHLGGRYWDFWDHHIPLTHTTMTEIALIHGLEPRLTIPRFLPYTMVGRKPPSNWVIYLYLKAPVLWRILGRQFLLVADKPAVNS